MTRRNPDKPPIWTMLLGALLGLGVSGYLLIYLPMSHNYAECGKVTLCHEEPDHD